jgi:cation:H+ antiporter
MFGGEMGAWAALIGGLVMLAISGDLLVRGAGVVGRKLGLSVLFTGVVIVGFGTSLPEMLVSVAAAARGVEGIAFGNIVGSNIANVWLVLGLAGLAAPIALKGIGLGWALVSTLLATAAWVVLTPLGRLDPVTGAAFLGALVVYLIVAVIALQRNARAGREIAHTEPQQPPKLSAGLGWAFVVIGLIGLPLASWLLVDGGAKVARAAGVSDRLIAVTAIALGTSLPEVAAAIAAALRHKGALVIGNVLGSNLFNILGAGGLVALFGPFRAAEEFQTYDHWVLGASMLMLALLITLRARVGRLGGLILIGLYALYIAGVVSNLNLSGLFGLAPLTDAPLAPVAPVVTS